MSKLRMSFACGLYDRMLPLFAGEVQPVGIDLNFLPIDNPRQIFDRMAYGNDRPARGKVGAQPDRKLNKRSTYAGVVDTGPVAGETFEQISEAHPQVTREAIQAALTFAADALRADVVYPIVEVAE